MKKQSNGTLTPYSFGHKWKDGRYVAHAAIHSRGPTPSSLRTDIPLKALNLHFGVNFSIVSQVNPHINLFFFSSRGAVGRPGMYHWDNSHQKSSTMSTSYSGAAIRVESLAQREQSVLTQRFCIVTHRKGRGWRGGYLGSAMETYLYEFLQDPLLIF